MRLYFAIIFVSLAMSILLTPDLRAEWRFEMFLGKASTCRGDLNIKQPSKQNDLSFQKIEYKDNSFRTPLYYGLRVSYFPHAFSNFRFGVRAPRTNVGAGLEVEFIHAKIYSKSEQMVHVSGVRNREPLDSIRRLGEMVQGFSMSHGLNFLFLNLVGRFALLKNKDNEPGKVVLYGRAGIGPSFPHVESVIDGKRQEQYEFHGPAYQLAIGTEINIWKKLSLLLEYKYTFVKVKNAKIAEGYASTKIRTNHWVFGLSRAF